MKKKLMLVLSLVLCVTCLGACGKMENKVDSNAKKAIEDGLKQLQEYDKNYLVSNVLEASDGTINSIEINVDGENYTEYPLDSDGNIGTISFGESADTQYLLYDWLTKDKKYYSVASEGEDVVYYSFPEDYGVSMYDRTDLYVSYMLKHFTSIREYDSKTANIVNGDEDFKVYKCELPAEYAEHILGLGSYGIYESIEKDTSDDNIKKLCGFYLEELGRTMTCSDAEVLIGIAGDGMLKYVNIEVGGIGNNLYLTKCVVTNDNVETRNKPDLSEAKKFETTLKDTADSVASYDNYDDAVKAMNEESLSDDTSEETSVDSVEETEEEVGGTSESEETTSEEVTSEEVATEEVTE